MPISKNKKGFTLIELLVVIAIIGILTAIVTTNFTQSKAKARDSKRVSDMAQIQLALELFFDRCNQYPRVLDINYSCPTNATIKLGNYISAIPATPKPTFTGFDIYARTYYVNNLSINYLFKGRLETKSSVLDDSYLSALTEDYFRYICSISSGINNCIANSSPTETINNGTSPCTIGVSTFIYCVVPK